MGAKRRIKITVEKEQTLIVHGRSSLRGWCGTCAAQVAMLTVEEAAAVVQATPRAIHRWVETEKGTPLANA